MKTRSSYNILLAVIFAAGMASCKKEPVAPAWFSNHSRFYYDYVSDTSYIPNYHQLSVSSGFFADELFFYESPVDTGITSWTEIFQIFGNGDLRSKADGLYGESGKDCGWGFSGGTFDFLSIPANPETGALIPQYGCGHSEAGNNKILIADTIITVPAGTYHAFCILHEGGDRSYWNRDVGIIMYEQWQHDRAYPFRLLATLKLRTAQ